MLISTNKNTLNKKALILIKQSDDVSSFNYDKGITYIKNNNNEIVGINLDDYSNYFSALEGVHTISEEQKKWIESKGIIISDFPWFSIGEIIEREPHPKSDKLFILKVQTNKELQIVTNSLNSLVGKKVVVANVGSVLPSGVNIKFSKVMGVESEGMLCGGETLGQEKTDGVLLVKGKTGSEYFL